MIKTELICGGMRFGKTSKMALKALEQDALLLVGTRQQVASLKARYPKLKCKTVWDYMRDNGQYHDIPVMIDNADHWLRNLVRERGGVLTAYSVSDYPQKLQLPKEVIADLKKNVNVEFQQRYLGEWLNDCDTKVD